MRIRTFLRFNTHSGPAASPGGTDPGRAGERRAGRILALLALFLLPVFCGWSQTLETLVAAYRERPSPSTKAVLVAYAESHPSDREGALALLAVGATEAGKEEQEMAAARLQMVKTRLPALADYAAFHRARALYGLQDYNGAIAELEAVLNSDPRSPLEADAVMLAGEIYLASNYGVEGARLLEKYIDTLPRPAGRALLARCYEAAGELTSAARAFQKVYYEYPVSAEAGSAFTALSRIRRRLGRDYPEAPAKARFTRVDALMRAGQHLTAREELQEMTERLTGADRDLARVWLGKARYIREHDSVAYRWLKSLKVSDDEAEAQRLYYLLESARRLGRRDEVVEILDTLGKKFPKSKWNLEALVSAGNMFLLENEQDRYVPVYRACAEGFPDDTRAAYCDWKVAWSYYIRRQPEAAGLLRDHIAKFPASEKVGAALYFLGRLAEQEGERDAARTWYRELEHEYPNFYYSFLARDRLAEVGDGAESASVREFLSGIRFPLRRHQKNFKATPLTEARLGRARLLFSAGLDEWGERELRFGARDGAQGPILAVELAASAAGQGDYGKSIRYIKGLAPGYLSMPLEAAPESFWRLTFPLAYRDSLETYAKRRDIDPFFLAALVRQESEFDPRAVSRARAYGLTQILPSTGRVLARELRLGQFRTSMLYQPEVNVNMGTYYLRGLIDDLDGHAEAALAAYNAGRSRARRWLTWGDFREPAEFVETIPFTETRTYVQTVLRNAKIYELLYDADSGRGD